MIKTNKQGFTEAFMESENFATINAILHDDSDCFQLSTDKYANCFDIQALNEAIDFLNMLKVELERR